MVFSTEHGDPLEIFTTRPDTLWGATFMVLAPEHPLVQKLTTSTQQAAVEAYVSEAVRQTDIERRRPIRRNPVCSPVGMLSIRLTARKFRCGSRIMS